MATLEPSRGSKPVLISIRYKVDQEWIDRETDESGIAPPGEWATEFDLRELESAAQRRELREAHRAYVAWSGWSPCFDHPIAEAAEAARALVRAVDLERRRREQAAAEAAAATLALEQAEARFHEKRTNWIALFGSRRLQLAAEGGYEHHRLYATERVVTEFPGGWVDTGRELKWRERANPSEAALLLELELAERLSKHGLDDMTHRVVWVTKWPREVASYVDEHAGYGPEADEAVIVGAWLGKWTVVMPLDPEYRSPTGADDATEAGDVQAN